MNNEFSSKLNSILGRRSIRTYEDKPINDEMIQAILETAMAAPSACAKDPWRFIVVREKEALNKIADGLPHGQMLRSAGVGFVICGDINAAHDNQLSYMLQDCSAAIENLLLAVHNIGLGAVWLGVHPREERMKHITQLFSLPENIIPIACIAVGYPAESKEARTRFDPDYVHYEKW